VKLTLHAIGRRMPAWTETGAAEYAKRLPGAWSYRLLEHPQAKGDTAAVRSRREAEALLGGIDGRDHVVALDERGRCHDSCALGARLEHWQSLGKGLALVIGGPDGHGEALLGRADERWSLSPATFPHPLVRVLVLEQLYRAWSLNANHPYHRGGERGR